MTTNHIKEIYSIFKSSSGISTDTRTIKNDSIYFAFHTLSIVVEIYLLSNIFKEKKNLHTVVSKIRIIN